MCGRAQSFTGKAALLKQIEVELSTLIQVVSLEYLSTYMCLIM